MFRLWPSTQRELAHQGTPVHDLSSQRHMIAGVDHVKPAARHGDSPSASLQGSAMGYRVDASSQSADDGDPVARKLGCDLFSNLFPIYGGTPGPNHCYGTLILRREKTPCVKQ